MVKSLSIQNKWNHKNISLIDVNLAYKIKHKQKLATITATTNV